MNIQGLLIKDWDIDSYFRKLRKKEEFEEVGRSELLDPHCWRMGQTYSISSPCQSAHSVPQYEQSAMVLILGLAGLADDISLYKNTWKELHSYVLYLFMVSSGSQFKAEISSFNICIMFERFTPSLIFNLLVPCLQQHVSFFFLLETYYKKQKSQCRIPVISTRKK